MVEVLRIAKENGSRSIFMENKFTNYMQCTTDNSPCLSVFKYSTATWQLSVNIEIYASFDIKQEFFYEKTWQIFHEKKLFKHLIKTKCKL